MENLTKNLKIDALSRYLNIKSIKKYFIKNLIKNLKKHLIKKKTLSRSLKMPYHETEKILYQKTLSRILKSALLCLKKIPSQKKPHPDSSLIKEP